MKKRILALFLAGMLSLHVLVAWNSRELVRKGYPDFTIFYSAGKIVRQGLGPHMYDEQVQYRVQQEFASGVSIRQGALPYNHPPFEALIFVTLTWLPYVAAYLLWDLVNLLILFALPFLLRPHLPMLRQTPVAAWLFVSLAFFPIFIGLLQGQDIILLLLLFTLAFVALKKGSDFTAGCWLALGLFRFHLVLPLMLILLLQKKRNALFGFVLVATGLVAVSIAIVGWKTTVAYPSYVWHVEQTMGLRRTVVPIGMPNVRGLFENLLTPVTPKILRVTATAVASVVLIFLATSKWKGTSGPGFDLGFSLCITTTVLVGYHAFAYDLSLLILPVALITNHVLRSSANRNWEWWILLAPAFVLFFTPLQMFLCLRNGRYSLMAWVLLLWGWAVAREISCDAAASLRKPGQAKR